MKLYNMSGAAKYLAITRRTLYKWLDDDQVPTPEPIQLEGSTRKVFTQEQLDEFKTYLETEHDTTPGRKPDPDQQLTKTIVTEDGEKKRVDLRYAGRRDQLLNGEKVEE